MKNRIAQLRKQHGLSQVDLAKELSIAQNTLSQYELGKRQIDNELLYKLADYFGVSIDYLLGRDDAVTKNIAPAKMSHRGVKIPVLGSVPAGVPIEAIEEVIDYEEIPEEWTAGGKEFFGLVVKGDSMYPEYLDGDVLIVRRQSECETGDDCIVYVNGDYEATFKRVERTADGSLRIKPINPVYPPVTYSRAEIASLPIQIAGVVWELRRKKR